MTVESLSGLPLGEGETLFLKKAIQIPVPREEGPARGNRSDESEAMEMGDASVPSNDEGVEEASFEE